MQPITASAKCALVAAGAVSVVPQLEVSGTSCSALFSAICFRRCASASGSAAPA
jgi:hypothetical protein